MDTDAPDDEFDSVFAEVNMADLEHLGLPATIEGSSPSTSIQTSSIAGGISLSQKRVLPVEDIETADVNPTKKKGRPKKQRTEEELLKERMRDARREERNSRVVEPIGPKVRESLPETTAMFLPLIAIPLIIRFQLPLGRRPFTEAETAEKLAIKNTEKARVEQEEARAAAARAEDLRELRASQEAEAERLYLVSLFQQCGCTMF